MVHGLRNNRQDKNVVLLLSSQKVKTVQNKGIGLTAMVISISTG